MKWKKELQISVAADDTYQAKDAFMEIANNLQSFFKGHTKSKFEISSESFSESESFKDPEVAKVPNQYWWLTNWIKLAHSENTGVMVGLHWDSDSAKSVRLEILPFLPKEDFILDKAATVSVVGSGIGSTLMAMAIPGRKKGFILFMIFVAFMIACLLVNFLLLSPILSVLYRQDHNKSQALVEKVFPDLQHWAQSLKHGAQ